MGRKGGGLVGCAGRQGPGALRGSAARVAPPESAATSASRHGRAATVLSHKATVLTSAALAGTAGPRLS